MAAAGNLRLTLDDFISRIKLHHICFICQVQFKINVDLEEHMKLHHNWPYICHVIKCNVICDNWQRFQQHMEMHSYTTGKELCTYCYKLFSSKSSLFRHWIRLHGQFQRNILRTLHSES
ncbi:PREDICTED: zinc finger protein 639-like [Vollenhovia emeryi]|uniref:zinc finger protein 639-like n=1 Tax=Vollenhovia emeryi TaxID=411798 RepID=UPI0005F38971|nr:PREDICTED: zinc finger protein 639-like [Vollenhovia emeryi]